MVEPSLTFTSPHSSSFVMSTTTSLATAATRLVPSSTTRLSVFFPSYSLKPLRSSLLVSPLFLSKKRAWNGVIVRSGRHLKYNTSSSTKWIASGPVQLKSASEDMKHLLNTKFCHSILYYLEFTWRFLQVLSPFNNSILPSPISCCYFCYLFAFNLKIKSFVYFTIDAFILHMFFKLVFSLDLKLCFLLILQSGVSSLHR